MSFGAVNIDLKGCNEYTTQMCEDKRLNNEIFNAKTMCCVCGGGSRGKPKSSKDLTYGKTCESCPTVLSE